MRGDDEADVTGEDNERRRERSPNYPSIAFGDALVLAKKIFDKDRRHPMTAETASKHLGYSGVNGTSKLLVSALRKYGLLEAHNGQLKISDDAAAVILLGRDNPERIEKMRRLALRPALFQEIIQEYPDGLPSDENLAATLQYRYNFTASAATRAIQSLRQSLAAIDGSTDETRAGEPGADGGPPAASAPVPATVVVQPAAASRAVPVGAGAHEVWDLGDGVRAELRITGALGPDQLDVLKQYIEVLAFKVSRSAKKGSDAAQE